MDFIARLVALVPKPRVNLTFLRYGLFARFDAIAARLRGRACSRIGAAIATAKA
jgi:hypothetical protein